MTLFPRLEINVRVLMTFFFEVNVWSTAKFDLQNKKIITGRQNSSKYVILRSKIAEVQCAFAVAQHLLQFCGICGCGSEFKFAVPSSVSHIRKGFWLSLLIGSMNCSCFRSLSNTKASFAAVLDNSAFMISVSMLIRSVAPDEKR